MRRQAQNHETVERGKKRNAEERYCFWGSPETVTTAAASPLAWPDGGGGRTESLARGLYPAAL